MSSSVVMTFGSLFAGIGGLDLGLERAGMECRWQVEIDGYAHKVLAKHWPNVRKHDDVRTWPQPDTEQVDLICGGFPCQGFSTAGKRQGLEDERSALWFEFERIIRILRPTYVLLENVAAILTNGFDVVLGSLATLGFDAEWDCLPAVAFGAPHERERIFVVAYSNSVVGGHGMGFSMRTIGKGRYRRESITNALQLTGGIWRPQPLLVEWMMGFPLRWTALDV